MQEGRVCYSLVLQLEDTVHFLGTLLLLDPIHFPKSEPCLIIGSVSYWSTFRDKFVWNKSAPTVLTWIPGPIIWIITWSKWWWAVPYILHNVLLVIENRESKQINTCKKYMTNDQLPQQKLLKSEIAPTGLVKVLATYLGIELSYLSQLAFNICFQGREKQIHCHKSGPSRLLFCILCKLKTAKWYTYRKTCVRVWWKSGHLRVKDTHEVYTLQVDTD